MAEPSYQFIIYEKLDAIARITLNRPEKLNAISEELRQELEAAVAESEADKDIRVIVIRGAGRAFCSGYDISNPDEYIQETFAEWIWSRERAQRWLKFWNCSKPTIAQVHGYCLAGGTELIGFCDLVIAADDAQLGHPPARGMGIHDTLGLWPLHIGMRKTKELLFTGKSISGSEAERIGLINLAVPVEDLERTVMEWARHIAQVPYECLAEHKYIVNRWFEIMGINSAVMAGADLDTLYHQTQAAKQFAEVARTRGLKGALQWRDAPFGDYSASDKK